MVCACTPTSKHWDFQHKKLNHTKMNITTTKFLAQQKLSIPRHSVQNNIKNAKAKQEKLMHASITSSSGPYNIMHSSKWLSIKH